MATRLQADQQRPSETSRPFIGYCLICFLILNVSRGSSEGMWSYAWVRYVFPIVHAVPCWQAYGYLLQSPRACAHVSKVFEVCRFGTLRRLSWMEPTHRLRWFTTQDSPSPPKGAAARCLGRSLDYQRSSGGKVCYGYVLLEQTRYWLHSNCSLRGVLHHGSNAFRAVGVDMK